MINQTLWVTTAALIVGGIVRAINTDAMSGVLTYLAGRDETNPVNVPPRLLPWLAVLFGGASSVLDARVTGTDWQTAAAGGLVSAALAALGHSLGKGVPVAKKIVAGRSSKLIAGSILIAALVTGTAACPHGGSSPTIDAPTAEAGQAAVTNVCDLIQGISDSGAVRSVCATVEEVISVLVPFILDLRATAPDAGAGTASAKACEVLPHTTLCATSDERARAIHFLTRVRQARYQLDAGR